MKTNGFPNCRAPAAGCMAFHKVRSNTCFLRNPDLATCWGGTSAGQFLLPEIGRNCAARHSSAEKDLVYGLAGELCNTSSRHGRTISRSVDMRLSGPLS